MESKFVVDEDATTNLLRTNAMTHDPMTNYGVVTEEYPVGYLSILRVELHHVLQYSWKA
jgi:hypothetical protein